MASLQTMRGAYPEEKIRMLAIFPGGGSPELVKKVYYDRWGIKGIPAYIDDSMKLFDAFDISGVPFSAVIDKNGKPGTTFLGAPSKADLQKALDAAMK